MRMHAHARADGYAYATSDPKAGGSGIHDPLARPRILECMRGRERRNGTGSRARKGARVHDLARFA
jgi:hypothetical protein